MRHTRHGHDARKKSNFHYESLGRTRKCIRLLEVLREGDGQAIRCKLRAYATESAPRYVALSYTWDRDDSFAYIECNGMHMRVGKNVSDVLALYQFRAKDPEKGGLIWIDAICINQADIGERNHQVDQMREIYSGATQVIVWLGHVVKDAAAAFNLSRILEEPSVIRGDDLRWYASWEQWKALADLLRRPYWTRVWIAQEFILAQSIELWCGAFSASALGFDRLARWLDDLKYDDIPEQVTQSTILTSPGWKLFRHRTLWWQRCWTGVSGSTFNLWDLLESYAEFESTDIRDKVFGFLGLATDLDTWKTPLQADYSKAPVEVVIDLIRQKCQWEAADYIQSHATAKFLLRILQVSDADLSTQVLKSAPDLISRLHLIVSKACMALRLRHVSTVTYGAQVAWKPIRPGRTEYSAHEFVWNSANGSILDFELSRATTFVPSAQADGPAFQRLKSLGSLLREHIVTDSQRTFQHDAGGQMQARSSLGWIQIYQSDEVWNGRGTTSGFRSMEQPMVVAGDSLHRYSFVDTNGRTGDSTCAVRSLDQVFVFADSGITKSALILRMMPEGYWSVVGAARICEQTSIAQSSSGLQETVNKLNQSGVDHLLSDRLGDMYLLTHPYFLRHLFLSGLIGIGPDAAGKSLKRKRYTDAKSSNRVKRNYQNKAKIDTLPKSTD